MRPSVRLEAGLRRLLAERWTRAAQRDGTRALGELRLGVNGLSRPSGHGALVQPGTSRLQDLALTNPDGSRIPRAAAPCVPAPIPFVAKTAMRSYCRTMARRSGSTAGALRHLLPTKRLRRLSIRRRGGRAHDLSEQIKLVSWLFGAGQPALALPPLGSALWDPGTTAHISNARLGNDAMLAAIRELSSSKEAVDPSTSATLAPKNSARSTSPVNPPRDRPCRPRQLRADHCSRT